MVWPLEGGVAVCDAAERSVRWTTNEGPLTASQQGGRCERIKQTLGVAGRAGGVG